MESNEAKSKIENRKSKIENRFIPHPSPLLEIGAAREDEIEAALRVMCAAYELPYEAARPIFYADPYFDAANKRVLRVDGRIVSCLTITTDAQCRIGRAVVPIAGVAGVATLPEQQRKGYAGRLLGATLHTLRERGCVLAGLYPYDYAYYRRFGWEAASVGCRYSVSPNALLAPVEYTGASAGVGRDLSSAFSPLENTGGVHPARLEHWQGMADVYERHAQGQALWAIRDEKRWRYLFDRVAYKYVCLDSAETVQGYLLYDIQPGSVQISGGQPMHPPVLNVLEFCANTAQARFGLLSHLATQQQVGKIEYTTTPQQLQVNGLLRLVLPSEQETVTAQINLVSGVMLRIVDFPRLLRALCQNWHGFKGSLVLTLHDELRSPSTIHVRIEGSGAALPQIREEWAGMFPSEARNAEPSDVRDTASPCGIEGNVRAWSQVVVGHISGDDACACGRLNASSPEAARLAGELFPPRFPFLPVPDHF